MVDADKRKNFFNISAVVIIALVLRMLFFSGFVLGDDPNYADDARTIIDGSYPPLGDLCVFSFRPVLLYSISQSLKWLGWSEFNFVLPVLLSSLISIYLTYRLAEILFDRSTGLLAALLLAVYPLDVIHASTMCNDIMLSMLVALALLFVLMGFAVTEQTAPLCFAAGGAVLGIAAGVKITAIPIIGLFLAILLYGVWRKKRLHRQALLFVLTWALVQSIFSMVYYIKTGDFFAHIHAELHFNKKFNPSGFFNTSESLKNALLFYPRYMLCLKGEGHPAYGFYPYGFVYPVFLAAVIYVICRRDAKTAIPLVWFTFLFLMMEFAPLRVSPYYQPIHRLIRFLAIISIPTVLIVARFIRQLYLARGMGKVLALLIMAGLCVTSLHQTYRKAYCYRDSMADARRAHDSIRHMTYRQVISDHEMKMILLFYDGFEHRNAFASFEYDRPQFAHDSLVILGGARRPDIDHLYAERFARSVQPQSTWVKVCEVQGNKEVWRKSNLVIYRIVGEDSRTGHP